MASITLGGLGEKLESGESIEEIAKEYSSIDLFSIDGSIPENITVETLIEIVEKVPGLISINSHIPVWFFLLSLVEEGFNVVDIIVSGIFKKEKYILDRWWAKKDSDTVCKTLSIIKQVTKEQISELLSIMEKRKNLLFAKSKEENAKFLIEYFLEPLKDYLSEENFFLLFDWVNKETKPYFFKEMPFYFFKQLPVDSQYMQEKLVEYFVSAYPSWLVKAPYRKRVLFREKEGLEKINTETFISSVVKVYPKLSDPKKVYLLNLPLFIEKYPQLAVKFLKVFIEDKPKYMDFIVRYNKIFIPGEVWDILVKKEPLLFIDLITELPIEIFSFDIDYVSDKAELLRFIYPEESEKVCTRLKVLKGLLKETPVYEIIKNLKNVATVFNLYTSSQKIVNAIKFVLDKLPYSNIVAFWILQYLLPDTPRFDEYKGEVIEDELRDIKEHLQEILLYLEEIKQENNINK